MRIFVIGAQCSGKTALARHLRANYGDITVVEMDEQIRALCGGEWPRDRNFKEQTLVPQVLKSLIVQPEVLVFFENHMSVARTRYLKDHGFMIVVLGVPIRNLLRRNQQRVLNEGYNNASRDILFQVIGIKVHRMFGLIDLSLDGTATTSQIATHLIDFMGHSSPQAPEILPTGAK